jgi:hypothetical protein
MNFDELWRANLHRWAVPATAVDKRKKRVTVIDDPERSDASLVDPERCEIDRYLDWLERIL